ncbi:MAG: 3-deoxy-D-manno-octulosonate 8-phosphate phosphatase (KDO 8-P phosphatase) [Gammaproteobacteria bacterium]|jgi:3-deoxy-D-manno-octulosonate 8-phosphate phosphatase (KDO 8-P phosphatase)
MSIDASKIKLIALDVDGTLTDGGIYIMESGDQFRKFNCKDGLGIKMAIQQGVLVTIISHSYADKLIEKRAQMMGIERCYAGQAPKLQILNEWCAELNISLDEVAYVGDDLNDVDVIEAAGLSACPADAMPAVRASCDVVLTRNGGDGCVREFLDQFFLGAARR